MAASHTNKTQIYDRANGTLDCLYLLYTKCLAHVTSSHVRRLVIGFTSLSCNKWMVYSY